jgi:uncharacterized protein YdhG (YjbR/CyaY superfamily)
MKSNKIPCSIDEYIAGFPPSVRQRLQQLRATITKAAPKAEEAISYRMPTFKLEGNLVYFAAFKKHIGFFPRSGAIEKFERELANYGTSKATIRFLYDRPIPVALVSRIVKFRVAENLKRAREKKKR